MTTSQQNQQSSQQSVQQTQANTGNQQQQQPQQQQQNTVITIPGTNNTIQIPSNFAGKLITYSSSTNLSFSLCGAWFLFDFLAFNLIPPSKRLFCPPPRSKRSSSTATSATDCSIPDGGSDHPRAGSHQHRQRTDDLPDRARSDSEFWQPNATNYPAADANCSAIHATVCEHHYSLWANPTSTISQHADDATASGDATGKSQRDAAAGRQGGGDRAGSESERSAANHDHERSRAADDGDTGPADAT